MSQTPISPALDPTPAWEQYLEKNFKKVLMICIAAVAGVSAYGLVQYSNHAKAAKAGEAFVAAKTIEDLDVVIQQHGGTLAAGNALLQKADLLWEQNKKTTSVDVLREFSTQYSRHPLYAQALLALASKVESLGNRSEAKPLFERLIQEFPASDVAAVAELRLGDLLWAEGKEEEAKKVYEGLPAKFPAVSAEILNQGESRKDWMAAKLPTKEVDGPPKPKEPAPAAPGMPQINLGGANPLSPTISSPTGGSNPQVINLTPGGSSTPITVAPSPSMPAPAPPTVPAAASTPPVSVPAPTAPASAAPAVPATPAPAAPAKAP